MRKKKRGRPRQPMIGVRLPASTLRKVTKLAEALSVDRSSAVRWLIMKGLDSGLAILLLRSSRGKRIADRIASTVAAQIRATAAQSAVERAAPADIMAAEIKALRASERAEAEASALADRFALAKAQKVRNRLGE